MNNPLKEVATHRESYKDPKKTLKSLFPADPNESVLEFISKIELLTDSNCNAILDDIQSIDIQYPFFITSIKELNDEVTLKTDNEQKTIRLPFKDSKTGIYYGKYYEYTIE